MRNPVKSYQENPFFRSTVNVIIVQGIFVLLSFLVFAFALWYQQNANRKIVEDRQAAFRAGYRLTPESLDALLDQVSDRTGAAAFLALGVLAVSFGYLSARYALNPTRQSLAYQKRFIGNIAHELRTPLSIIRTNTEVALMDPALTEDARETFRLTIDELGRISGIINNLLSFDSLTRPGRMSMEPILVRKLAHEVVERHAQMAQQYGINIGVDTADEPAYVMGNRTALEQALTNLVKNALNYTPQHDGRSVLVRVDSDGPQVVLSVIDTGIGIAQKDLSRVFQPYYRGDTSRERGIGSGTSGLGLAIVYEIVRAHNGSIVIRSALNRGTTIELSFPKTDVAAANEQAALDEDGEEHEETIS